MPSSAPTSVLLAGLGQLLALLGDQFAGPSWSNWRTLLRAAFDGVETLTDDERAFVEQITGRTVLPTPAALRELWFVVGRRAGKSRVAALLAVWAATCRAYALAAGKVARARHRHSAGQERRGNSIARGRRRCEG